MVVVFVYIIVCNIYICRVWGGMDCCRCKKGECDVVVFVFCCIFMLFVFYGLGVLFLSRVV